METLQNPASAFIYHSNPDTVLAMSCFPPKSWAWLGKQWVRSAPHELQEPRKALSSHMDWSCSRVNALKHGAVWMLSPWHQMVTSTPCWGKEVRRVSHKKLCYLLPAVTGGQPGTSHILLLCLSSLPYKQG